MRTLAHKSLGGVEVEFLVGRGLVAGVVEEEDGVGAGEEVVEEGKEGA